MYELHVLLNNETRNDYITYQVDLGLIVYEENEEQEMQKKLT